MPGQGKGPEKSSGGSVPECFRGGHASIMVMAKLKIEPYRGAVSKEAVIFTLHVALTILFALVFSFYCPRGRHYICFRLSGGAKD